MIEGSLTGWLPRPSTSAQNKAKPLSPKSINHPVKQQMKIEYKQILGPPYHQCILVYNLGLCFNFETANRELFSSVTCRSRPTKLIQ